LQLGSLIPSASPEVQMGAKGFASIDAERSRQFLSFQPTLRHFRNDRREKGRKPGPGKFSSLSPSLQWSAPETPVRKRLSPPWPRSVFARLTPGLGEPVNGDKNLHRPILSFAIRKRVINW